MAAVANVAINLDSRGVPAKLKQIADRSKELEKSAQGASTAVSKTGRELKTAANGMQYFIDAAGRARKVNGQFVTTAEAAAAGLDKQGRSAQRAAGNFNGLIGTVGKLAAGFGATFALGKIISDVAKLDTNLRRLETVGGDVQGLSKALDQVGKNVEGLAGKAELAAASYQALSAGFTDTAQNARVVEAATKAAVGGLVDVTSVVEVTTKTLNAYGMSGNEAIKVTDSISKAIEYGQVQWSDYTSQLGKVAGLASIAGVSLDEVNAFIAASTKNSATAEQAFTGLAATLSNMLTPTKESAEAAAALGINFNLSGIRTEGFASLISKLAVAMKENPELASKMVGGQEAIRGAFQAANNAGSDYKTILEGLGGAAGKTESDFEKMKGSLENQIKALNTAFTALGTKLFEVFGPTLTDLITGTTTALTNAVDAFNALPEPVKKGTAELVKMIAQLLLVKKAIEGIIALRTAFVAAMVAIAGAIDSTGTAAKTSASVLRGLLGVLGQLALIGTITIAVNIITSGVQQLMDAKRQIEELQGRKAAGGAAAQFAGETRAQGELRQKTARSTIKAIEKERPGLERQIEVLRALPGGAGRLFTRNLENRLEVLKQREDEARRNLALPLPPKPKPPELPELPTTPTNIDGGGAGTKAAAKVKETDAQRAAKIKEIRAIERDIFEARRAGNEVLAAQLEAFKTQTQIQQRGLGIEEETQLLLQNGERLNERLKELDDQRLERLGRFLQGTTEPIQAQTDVIKNYQQETNLLEMQAQKGEAFVEKFKDINKLMMDGGLSFSEAFSQVEERTAAMASLNKEADMFQQALSGAGDIIGNQLRGAIDGLIDGTADWNNILRDTLSQLGSFFLNLGLNQLAGGDGIGILSRLGFGTRANGGPVNANQPYIVGERGPELFMPSSSGSITSNETLQAQNRAFLDSVYTDNGGPASDDSETEHQATVATRAAIRESERIQENRMQIMSQQKEFDRRYERERIEQMASTPGKLDIKYESQVINNVEYVTREQAERMAAQSALRGRELAIGSLQNSVKTRKRVGIS